MIRKSLPWLATLTLVWALVFFARIDEAQLKMDGMTYAAIAKHIVSSGDWKNLHYTKSAFDTFYIHPPLVLWMQAGVFKLLGVSVPAARLLPGLFALGTAAAVFEWGVLAGGAWLGFVSVLILFTSLTYIKYASDFILDGPLAFWLTFGSLCFLRLERGGRKSLNVFLFGLSITAAFFSKGIVSASLPAAALGYAVFAKKADRARLSGYWVAGLLIAGLLLCPWLFMAGGTDYLKEYWHQSVTIRMKAESFSEHWVPLKALVDHRLALAPDLVVGRLALDPKKSARAFQWPDGHVTASLGHHPRGILSHRTYLRALLRGFSSLRGALDGLHLCKRKARNPGKNAALCPIYGVRSRRTRRHYSLPASRPKKRADSRGCEGSGGPLFEGERDRGLDIRNSFGTLARSRCDTLGNAMGSHIRKPALRPRAARADFARRCGRFHPRFVAGGGGIGFGALPHLEPAGSGLCRKTAPCDGERIQFPLMEAITC